MKDTQEQTQKVVVYDIIGVTHDEKQAVAAVLGADSTVAPVKFAPYLTSFIQKFNAAQPREIEVGPDGHELPAKPPPLPAGVKGGNGDPEKQDEDPKAPERK